MEDALAGIRIADFSWIGAGPLASRTLADFGATCIRVESSRVLDILRISGPYKDNIPGIDRSAFFANFNTNKFGVTLNLRHPKGRELALKLALWADIVTDSMAAGSMARFGLDYQTLAEQKPSIIMFSTTQQGQNGPYQTYAGTGSMSSALGGLTGLVGWPDREPPGLYGAYTDFISPWLIVSGVLAALDYRRRTGKGQYIDQSQTESAMFFGGLALLDYTANGRIWTRWGNCDPGAAPHNAYRCQGDDRWCAISVTTTAEWRGLCDVLALPDLAADSRFMDIADRLARVAELDPLIEKRTMHWDAYELMRALQMAGVPSGVLQKASDLFEDPQLAARGHFYYPEHPVLGRHAVHGSVAKLSDTPAKLRRPSPCIGQHNEFVLGEVLGLNDEEIAEIIEEGVLE